jgi:hypothetical protein
MPEQGPAIGASIDRPPDIGTPDPFQSAQPQDAVGLEGESRQLSNDQRERPVPPVEALPAARASLESQTPQALQNQSVAANRPKAPQPEATYANAQPLNAGRLRIQALVWAPNVEDRMAVINNHIVHEGEKVDGFTILAIGQDDVVVGEKGTPYRVAFGSP